MPKPGRPRSEVARRAVLDASYGLLCEAGAGGFSIDAVAQRAGVARTTIYRSWPSKGLLAVETLLEAFRRELVYRHGPHALTDFRHLIDSLVRLLGGPTGRIAASIVAEAQGDPATRQAFLDGFSKPLRQQSAQILARGISSGDLRGDLDIPVVLDAVVGGAYMRLLMGQSLEPAWSRSIVDTILRGCLATNDLARGRYAPLDDDAEGANVSGEEGCERRT